jgi:uncharacterized protein (DUF2147 family)
LPAADLSSPLGQWKTIDDKTGAPRAIVRIEQKGDKYFGHIEESFTPGAKTRVCSECTDDRKNQPIIGLEVIRNMSRRDEGYAGGEILDPDSGWVYRCKFHLEDGGQKLLVRGYLGISLFGRTQTWVRVP